MMTLKPPEIFLSTGRTENNPLAAIEITTRPAMKRSFLDGGMMMSDKPMTADGSIADCYFQAFSIPYDANDVVVLIHEEDCEA